METFDTGCFDLEMRLPSGPLGASWDGAGFVVANREDPWGFFRIRPEGQDWMLQTVPVVETDYAQRMDISGFTWNGSTFVGVTSGAWFRKNDILVFTVHDPATLQITEVLPDPAPALTGAIAWDGSSYWIATRRNTQDSGEPARLARLDASFRETGSWDPPGVGCQGLAWDGAILWFADVFDQSLIALDVSADPPAVVHRHDVGSYPSGVVWDGSCLVYTKPVKNVLLAWEVIRKPPSAGSEKPTSEEPRLTFLSENEILVFVKVLDKVPG